jgi:hypothetical protein
MLYGRTYRCSYGRAKKPGQQQAPCQHTFLAFSPQTSKPHSQLRLKRVAAPALHVHQMIMTVTLD